jgi:hypothetical protein
VIPLPIPTCFIIERTQLSWRDALFAYERQLIGWTTIVELAQSRLRANEDLPSQSESELATLDKSNTARVGELLRTMAMKPEEADAREVVEPKDKWLYLLLAWLYENRASVADPLADVEAIYTDFDYPAEITSFVRYMPATDGYEPNRHTEDENRERLYGKWLTFLDAYKARISGA